MSLLDHNSVLCLSVPVLFVVSALPSVANKRIISHSLLLRYTVEFLYADVSGSRDFLAVLEGYRRQSFPAITLKKGERLSVCGETLETCDLETLLRRNWLNDKVCALCVMY